MEDTIPLSNLCLVIRVLDVWNASFLFTDRLDHILGLCWIQVLPWVQTLLLFKILLIGELDKKSL